MTPTLQKESPCHPSPGPLCESPPHTQGTGCLAVFTLEELKFSIFNLLPEKKCNLDIFIQDYYLECSLGFLMPTWFTIPKAAKWKNYTLLLSKGCLPRNPPTAGTTTGPHTPVQVQS